MLISVSKEPAASIFRTDDESSTLKMEAAVLSKYWLTISQTEWDHISEDNNLQKQYCNPF
jgi:hypothetical protein